ncbi:unnamed protein product [Brassicogethes aeneus]|uniref:Small integral membrane protein 8 n=1 Tax=Brassicogethes aeneus TaxID=1431903 RepID=A0A9P0B9M1_BRAAE|nr:unnamed protein product [Brassicogethes aeneus]
MNDQKEPAPGDGIRSLKTSRIFKAVNFELYAKPNLAIMGLGLIALATCTGYIAYMRYQHEQQGYYTVVKDDGTETFLKKKSKWD